MNRTRDIADRYVEQAARLDPVGATSAGLTGFDHLMTELTPAGLAARATLARATLAELEQGSAFDLKEFHREALALGSIGTRSAPRGACPATT
jgi:hypothetical protein